MDGFAPAVPNEGRPLLARLRLCTRAATITEYALVAAVAVLAWGGVSSPRFQAVKDDPCAPGQAECGSPVAANRPLLPAVTTPPQQQLVAGKPRPKRSAREAPDARNEAMRERRTAGEG